MSTQLPVTYDGPALASGRMDIRILAGAMASVAQLVEDSARLVHGADTGIRIEVSGDFRSGSFTYQTISTAVSGITQEQLKEFLVWLGLLSTPTGLSVAGVLKWLNGRKIKRVTREGANDAKIVSGDGSVIVNMQIAQLVVNQTIREDFERITQPLAESGIVVMRTGEEVDSPALEIIKEELPSFLAPPAAAETVHDGEAVAVLQLVSPSFKIGHKWQFAYPGEGAFFAPILDAACLKKLQRRDVSFYFGDLVRVRLRTSVTRTENGALSTTREILEVLEKIEPPKQEDLFEE